MSEENKNTDSKPKIKLTLRKSADSAKQRLASTAPKKSGGAVTVQVKSSGRATSPRQTGNEISPSARIAEEERKKKLALIERAKQEEESGKPKVKQAMPEEVVRQEIPVKKEEKPSVDKKPVNTKGFTKAATPAKPVGKKISLNKGWEDGGDKKPASKPKAGVDDRRRGKITLTTVLDDTERQRSLASIKRARAKAKKERADLGIGERQQDKITRNVIIPETITVGDLAARMAEKTPDVIKELMKLDIMAAANQVIDGDTAELVCQEFGHNFSRVAESDIEDQIQDIEDAADTLEVRAPVVTIMGHVDHGKTSLLDFLRSSRVAEGESGGITQHIGAYQVEISKEKAKKAKGKAAASNKITFIDTPGHAAFTEMRARGAKLTDIVILVVAADDGVKDQTKEAIAHAKAAKTPIIIACNKMDKPEANPQRVKNELLENELVTEEFGGDVMFVEVSAKEGTGIDELKEAVLIQSEMLELKANPNRNARAIVVESRIDKGRGVVATVIVNKGTLKVGQIVLAGKTMGKVRALLDDKGKNVVSAGPSQPVEVIGLSQAPSAGAEMVVTENEKTARDIAEFRMNQQKNIKAALDNKSAMERLFSAPEDSKNLSIIIKADVDGSIEAIKTSLLKLNTEEVSVKVIHTAVGGITESDITLANASDAFIVGFNVRANSQAKELANKENVEVRYYSIIYEVLDEVRDIMEGLLDPEAKEVFIGYAEIREVFNISKFGKIAGCYVTEGNVKRGAGVRLLRDNVVIHQGKLKTLKRFKDEVKEVAQSYECGMAFENYDDIKLGDIIEAFEIVETKRTLDSVKKKEA